MTTQTLPATTQDRLNALKQRAEQPQVEIWQPVAGDSIAGVLLGSERTSAGMYGGTLIILQTEQGIIKTWLTDWLKKNLLQHGVEKGDLIALTFHGKKFTPQGKPFNSYSVAVDKA